MTKYHVTIEKFCRVTVEADSAEEAFAKADWDERNAGESNRRVSEL